MNRCSIWNRLVYVLSLWQQSFKNYDLSSTVMYEERKMVIGNMQLQTVLLRSLCFFYKSQTNYEIFTMLQQIDLCHFRLNKYIATTGIVDLLCVRLH